MFEATLPKASLLKKIIESIKDMVTEASFECSDSAVSLQAMDSSHIALVSLKMEVGLFDRYRCDRTINIGISLENLHKALKCASNDDNCILKFDDGDRDNVTFIFNDPKGLTTQNVSVKTMDIQGERTDVPFQEYSVVCEMPSIKFQKTCKDLAMFSDSLNIKADRERITFSSSGENGRAIVHCNVNDSPEESEAVSIEAREPVNVSFSIKYINFFFTKATSLSNRVRMQLSNDVPLILEYPIEDAGYLRFYLAPKIDDDDY